MIVILNVLILSLLAGLATGLGGLIVILRKPGPVSSGIFMGFASGVMITIAFVGLIEEAWSCCGIWIAAAGFALGALFMFAIDVILPHTRFGVKEKGMKNKLLAAGTMMAIGITIHNLPEGIAMGAGYLYAPAFGLLIAIGIALHNIPEGMATALPLYLGGQSRGKALKITFLSGLVEPLGAMLAVFLLTGFQLLIPLVLAFAAGVMFFITLDELLPCAQCSCHEHATGLGIIIGAVLMLIIIGIFNI